MNGRQFIYHMRGLNKTYPGNRKVLENINLSFYPDAKIGVLGVNGSGKSTLLRIMAGIDTDFTGDGQLTDKGAVFGRVDIRAASLDTGIGRRDKHLRSADFFDVDRFGEISVVVTAVHPTKGKAADLRTSFTIKGVTAEVPLAVVISELDDGSIRITGETKLDRDRFDLGWNRGGMMSSTATVAADAIFVRVSQ